MSDNTALDTMFARAVKFYCTMSKAAIVSTPAGWYKISVVMDPEEWGVNHHDGVYLEPYDGDENEYIVDPEVDFDPDNFGRYNVFTWEEFIDQYDRAKGWISILGVQKLQIEGEE